MNTLLGGDLGYELLNITWDYGNCTGDRSDRWSVSSDEYKAALCAACPAKLACAMAVEVVAFGGVNGGAVVDSKTKAQWTSRIRSDTQSALESLSAIAEINSVTTSA